MDDAVEVEVSADDGVGAGDEGVGAGEGIDEVGNLDGAVADGERAGHAGGDEGGGGGVFDGLFGCADVLRAKAEGVYFLLNVGVREGGAGNGGRAAGDELEDEALLAGGDVDVAGDVDGRVEQRGLGVGEEGEEILGAAVGDADVEGDVVAGDCGGGFGDEAVGGDGGVKEVGGDRLQGEVAVGAIDEGLELSVDGEGVGGDVEGEVGGFCGAVDGDGAELAADVAGGREGAFEAFDVGEVGVGVGVVCVDGGGARGKEDPWADVAGGVDFSVRDGDGEDGFEEEGLGGLVVFWAAGVDEDELVEVEDDGGIFVVGALEDEGGIGADEAVEEEGVAGLVALGGVGVGLVEVLGIGAGGDGEDKALGVSGDGGGVVKDEVGEGGGELESADDEHGGAAGGDALA